MDLVFPLRRAFVALPLEEEAKEYFQSLQRSLEDYAEFLRFQNPESPHLTLHYFGDVMQIEYEPIRTHCERMARDHKPFTLHVTGAETFGDRGNDRVLHLSIAFSEELARLKKSSPWPDGKPFAPHITLARINHPQKFAVHKKKIMKLLDHAQFEIPVDRIRLYAEIDGKKQTALEDFALHQ